MVEIDAVKLWTIGDRECLSLPKQEAKDADAISNRTKNDLDVFQLQLDKLKSSLCGHFSSFKQYFITDVSQFKSDFLCKKVNSQWWEYHRKASSSDGKGIYFSTWKTKVQEHHNNSFIREPS